MFPTTRSYVPMDDEFDVDFSQFDLRPAPHQSSSFSPYYDRSPSPLPSEDDDWPPRMSAGIRNPLPTRWSPPPNRSPSSPRSPVARRRPPSPSNSISDRLTQIMLAPRSPTPPRRAPMSPPYRTEHRPSHRSPSPVHYQKSLVGRGRPPSPSESISDRLTKIMMAPPDSPKQPRPIQNGSYYHNKLQTRRRSPQSAQYGPDLRSRPHSPISSHYRPEPRRRSPSPVQHRPRGRSRPNSPVFSNYTPEPRQRSPSPVQYRTGARSRPYSPVSMQHRPEPRQHSPSPPLHRREPRRRSPSPRRYHPDLQQRQRSPPPSHQHNRMQPDHDSGIPAYRRLPRPPTPPKPSSRELEDGLDSSFRPHRDIHYPERNVMSKGRPNPSYINDSSSEDVTLPRNQKRRKPSPSKKRRPSTNSTPLPSRDPKRDNPDQERPRTKSFIPQPPPLPDHDLLSSRSQVQQKNRSHTFTKDAPERLDSGRPRSQSHYNQSTRRKKQEAIRDFMPYDPKIPSTPMPDYEEDSDFLYLPRPDY